MPVTALIWVFLQFWEFETKANRVCTKISMVQRERCLPIHATSLYPQAPEGLLRSQTRPQAGSGGGEGATWAAPHRGRLLRSSAGRRRTPLRSSQPGGSTAAHKRAERRPGPAPPHGTPVRTPRPARPHPRGTCPPEHRGLDRRILCTGCYS